MCWTITIGTGATAGRAPMILPRASGPPVDEPIATMSTFLRGAFETAGGVGGDAAPAGAALAAGLAAPAVAAPARVSRGRRLTTRTPAIVLTVPTISCERSAKSG